MPVDLLETIRGRGQKRTQFGYGITTADRHVKSVLDALGLQACYRYGTDRRNNISFDDTMKRAAQTLVYSNEDMLVESSEVFDDKRRADPLRDVELPNNTLMVFRHCLTSSKKDRDEDILRSNGAVVDPNMLLLWQHMHTLPIGKFLAIAKQNTRRLECISAIVDINALAHDAAVMIDNKMGRFSHGFRPIEYEPIENQSWGFDIKEFEVMEESLVSVPANPDAETLEVLLDLVEGGKLTSGVMKSYGQTIRESRPMQWTVNVSINEEGGVTTYGKTQSQRRPEPEPEPSDNGGEDPQTGASKEAGTTGGDGGGETGGDGQGEGEAGAEAEAGDENKEVDERFAPDELGQVPSTAHLGAGEVVSTPLTPDKSGRALSKANEAKLRDVRSNIEEALELDPSRAVKALLRESNALLDTILSSLGEDEEAGYTPPSIREAIVAILTRATDEERRHIFEVLQALENVEVRTRRSRSLVASIR
jgi:hypothetical protein